MGSPKSAGLHLLRSRMMYALRRWQQEVVCPPLTPRSKRKLRRRRDARASSELCRDAYLPQEQRARAQSAPQQLHRVAGRYTPRRVGRLASLLQPTVAANRTQKALGANRSTDTLDCARQRQAPVRPPTALGLRSIPSNLGHLRSRKHRRSSSQCTVRLAPDEPAEESSLKDRESPLDFQRRSLKLPSGPVAYMQKSGGDCCPKDFALPCIVGGCVTRSKSMNDQASSTKIVLSSFILKPDTNALHSMH